MSDTGPVGQHGVTLAEQIAAVRREIDLLERIRPGRKDTDAMRAVLATLEGMAAPTLAQDLNAGKVPPPWLSPDTAPRDGTEIRIMLDFPRAVPAYWDAEMRTFVLGQQARSCIFGSG